MSIDSPRPTTDMPSALRVLRDGLSSLATAPRPGIVSVDDIPPVASQLETLGAAVQKLLRSETGRTLDSAHSEDDDPEKHPVSWLLALLGEWADTDMQMHVERLVAVEDCLRAVPQLSAAAGQAMIRLASMSVGEVYARLDMLVAAADSLAQPDATVTGTQAAATARDVVRHMGEILSAPGLSPAGIILMLRR